MIEIDDAGGGCFVGPEVLVVHRLEPDQAWFLYIPPYIRERIDYAAVILKRAFQELKISREETVKLCRGEIFDQFEIYLREHGYSVSREKVSPATDELAEAKFMEILYSYGFPRTLSLANRNYHDFYELVGYWYFSLEKGKLREIRKIRLNPPPRSKKVANKFPNLLRLLFQEEVAG
jgi:hypothetical protein